MTVSALFAMLALVVVVPGVYWLLRFFRVSLGVALAIVVILLLLFALPQLFVSPSFLLAR